MPLKLPPDTTCYQCCLTTSRPFWSRASTQDRQTNYRRLPYRFKKTGVDAGLFLYQCLWQGCIILAHNVLPPEKEYPTHIVIFPDERLTTAEHGAAFSDVMGLKSK